MNEMLRKVLQMGKSTKETWPPTPVEVNDFITKAYPKAKT